MKKLPSSSKQIRNYLEGSFLNKGVERTCYISTCGLYRYWLRHTWDEDRPLLGFCLLNPSKADAKTDDRTVSKITRYAIRWGYGSFVIVNLFAFRATDPQELYTAKDPIGPRNDMCILDQLDQCNKVVLGWGNHGSWRGRAHAVLGMMRSHLRLVRLTCLGANKDGSPIHFLYQPDRAELVPYLV